MKSLMTFATALIVGMTANSLALAGGKGVSSGSGSKSGSYGHSSHGSSYGHSSHSSSWYHGSSSGSKTYYKGGSTHYKGGSSSKSSYQNYHLTSGKKFSKGYFYPGKYHKHWNYCCFNKNFGCYLYFCPCTCCWYYFCVPDCCYYPVCYVPYSCYCWGAPVCYCSAPLPPADVDIPDPVNVIGPTE
jgi:hypothetical protein